jgi:hypothetical protein
MIVASTALARDYLDDTISIRTVRVGKLLLDILTNESAQPRRFRVRDWVPSDGGSIGWHQKAGCWVWGEIPLVPCGGGYVTIIRLSDNAKHIAPRGWWRHDPSGLPRDDDSWAEGAWRACERHVASLRRWFRK